MSLADRLFEELQIPTLSLQESFELLEREHIGSESVLALVLTDLKEKFKGRGYAIGGGTAISVHTKAARRMSADMDIIVTPSLIKRLRKEMDQEGYKWSNTNLGVSLQVGNVDIDFMEASTNGSPDFHEFAIKTAKNATGYVTKKGMKKIPATPVVSAESMVIFKLLAEREKDLNDVKLLFETSKNPQALDDTVKQLILDFFPDQQEDLESDLFMLTFDNIAA